MDSSRRAVEAYWRSRMIDGVTSDEDKVAPVYKLEEICELLRSSHVSIVKEVSEYIFKRLDHKSPVVKQKALRLIKYAVGKSGVEFRREMQRHSAVVRQLFHYKGHVDPLKGDALNKAVRDTAHEAISAIFASEESKASPAEDLNRRIEGFGNTNFEMASDDRKSFLSEVVGIGSASIKLGLSNLTAAHSLKKNDTGTYKSPNLRRSLTTDINSSDRYDRGEHHSETRISSGFSSASSGTWGHDSNVNVSEMTNGDSSSTHAGSKSREERLLETIVTTGGVRLQPTRDAIQVFLVEASKLDAVALSRALEIKLQSHLWQVRMKAVCVLDSILRKKDDPHFEVIASYFSDNKDTVVKCSESPQASLREKAMRVLSLLDGGNVAETTNLPENPSSVKAEAAVVVQMPDLIDTGDSDDYYGQEELNKKLSDTNIGNLMTSETPVTNDLFGDSLIADISTNESKNEDPFAGVSFHTTENSDHVSDLFSGLNVDDKQQGNVPSNKNGPELLDLFGPSSELMQEPTGHNGDLQDLMAGMSNNENNSGTKQQGLFSGTFSEATFNLGTQPSHQVTNDALSGAFSSQTAGMNPNVMFPVGAMQYNVPPGIMLNQAFASNSMNYGAMGNFFTQQQFLAAMSNFQSIGNLSAQPNANLCNVVGNNREEGFSSPLPDIFHPSMPVQTHSTMMASTKKEETKAFDFISDHLSAARGSKRVV